MDARVRFSLLVDMLEAMTAASKAAMRRKRLRTFLDRVYSGSEGEERNLFGVLRLILPQLDRERGSYGLKEAALARAFVEALGLARTAPDARKLLDWRKGGLAAGRHAGNFALVLAEVLQARQKEQTRGVTIAEVNALLDRLAAAETREGKVAVLSEMLGKTNVKEMKWIAMIILKELKLGVGEKSVLAEFHADAAELFSTSCDLRAVCAALLDRTQRCKRQDIEPGKAVLPQLATRVASSQAAWTKMRGKEVVAEVKFDGDRIQLHKNGKELHFYSRNFIDHTEYMEGMSTIILENVLLDKCILDGELGAWDSSTNQFAAFGSNQSAAKAARENIQTDRQLCYAAFDILYCADSSVTHRPLRDRHDLLRRAVRPVRGRLELVCPQTARRPGEPLWSKPVHTAEELEHFFLETVENGRQEGIMVKDLDSKWDPGDRSGKWLKLKPDYVNMESDLDVLIIGGKYGSGRRGGEISQFLLGIAEKPKSGGYPTRFISFCNVGTGLTDAEAEHLRSRLKPYLRKNEKDFKPPSFYKLTNHHKERPDVWVEQPERSVVLQIKSDIRTIRTEVFAAPFSLRFPRIEKIRYDKPWHDCLDDETLLRMVAERQGHSTQREPYGALQEREGKRERGRGKGGGREALLPPHLQPTHVAHLQRRSDLFHGLVFYFVNASEPPPERLREMAAENGGCFSMNLSSEVTHSVAGSKRGFRYTAAAQYGDVLHVSWFLDCIQQQTLLHPKPRHYIHLSPATKKRMAEEIDEFGDSYFEDVEVDDVIQIFSNMDASKLNVDAAAITRYKEKYCPGRKWCIFNECRIFALPPIHSMRLDSRDLADCTVRRLMMEAEMHGSQNAVSIDKSVTHFVTYSLPENRVPFQNILRSVAAPLRDFLRSEKVRLVSHGWLEDCVKSQRRIEEDGYELRLPSEIQAVPEIPNTNMTTSYVAPGAILSLSKPPKDRIRKRNVQRAQQQLKPPLHRKRKGSTRVGLSEHEEEERFGEQICNDFLEKDVLNWVGSDDEREVKRGRLLVQTTGEEQNLDSKAEGTQQDRKVSGFEGPYRKHGQGTTVKGSTKISHNQEQAETPKNFGGDGEQDYKDECADSLLDVFFPSFKLNSQSQATLPTTSLSLEGGKEVDSCTVRQTERRANDPCSADFILPVGERVQEGGPEASGSPQSRAERNESRGDGTEWRKSLSVEGQPGVKMKVSYRDLVTKLLQLE